MMLANLFNRLSANAIPWLLGTLALACLVVWLQASRLEAAGLKLQASQARVQALQGALAAETGATQLRARRGAQAARKHAEQAASAASAVAANPEWAATPLPKEVQDAIPD